MKKHGFKRGFAGLAAIGVMCAAMPAFPFSAAETLAGDINLDGTVSVVDAAALQQYIHGKHSLSQSAYNNADIIADKAVNGFDLAMLKRILLSNPVSSTVSIYLSDSGITVKGDDNKTFQITDKTAKITASGVYQIYGEITEGQIYVETAAEDLEDVELVLNDVTMTNSTKSCIYTSVNSGSDKTKITLNGTNTLTDNAAAAYTESGVIYTNNKLTITKSGTGTLNINSSMNTGIYADKKMNLNGGTIVVNTADFSETADADAIVADNAIEIEGAVIDVDSSADGLKSKDEGVFLISGDVTVKAGNDAVQATTEITVSGGSLTAGGDRGLRLDEAGALNITGGKVIATATDYQITGAGTSVVTTGSTQAVMLLDMAAEWTKNDAIAIADTSGKTLCEFDPNKKYSYVLVSDAALSASGTYQVYVGGTQMTHSTSTAGAFKNSAAATEFYTVAPLAGGSTQTTGTVSAISFDSSGVTLYDASGNTVSPNESVSVSGSNVTIKKAGEYEVNGSSSNGRLVVSTDDAAEPAAIVQLNLTGLTLSNSTMAPIFVENVGDECVISAKSGSVNTISDGKSHTDTQTNSEGTAETVNGAIYACDDLKIKGTGSLTVNGNTEDGIVCKNDLKIWNSNLTVNAVDDALRGNDSVTIGDADDTDFSALNVKLTSASGDGIKTNATSDAEGEGAITVNGGTVNVDAYSDGFHASRALTVNGGDITVKTSASASGDASAKGLKAGCTDDAGTAVTGTITVNGGKMTIDSTDDSIHASGDITLVGGVMELTTGDDGVHSDADVTIGKGSADTYDDVQIIVYSGYEGIEGLNITMNSGTVVSTTTDDGFNAAGGADGSGMGDSWGGNWGGSAGGSYSLNMKGGFSIVSTASGDHDGFDSNGNLTVSGGIHVSNGQEPFDCDGTLSYTGGVYVKNGGSGGGGGGMMGGGGSMTESVNVSASVSANTRITLCDGSGNVIVSFIADKSVSSLVAGCTAYSGAAFYTGGTLNGSSYFQELDQTQLAAHGGTLNGGTQVSGSSSGSTTRPW